MIQTRVGLQAALNGDRTKAEHAATPISVEQLARDAAACVAAGAPAIHLHPRDPEGRETLEVVLPNYQSRLVSGDESPMTTTACAVTSCEVMRSPLLYGHGEATESRECPRGDTKASRLLPEPRAPARQA